MGCIYNSFDGVCQLFDKNNKEASPEGCDNNGVCMVNDDPDPNVGCGSYETDFGCFHCGADFNLDEECTCGEE